LHLTKATWLHLLPLALTLLVGLGCGKKAEINQRDPVRTVDPINGEMEALLMKQTVDCDNGLACPGGMAKVAIVDKNKLKFCTGFLVNSVTLATSSSCLTQSLRLATEESRCQKDVHVFFARSGFSESRRVGCKRLLLASQIPGNDPILWRNDISYIELSEPVYRRSFRLSRDATEDRKYLTMWKVDADNDEVGIIRKQDCQIVLNSYVNPISNSAFSPVMTLSGCEFKKGNTGSILLSPQGRWRGMVSQPVDKTLVDFLNNSGLMVEPLASLVHASSAACLPSVLESDPATERDCFKDLDYRQVDRQRSEMLNTEVPYQYSRGEIAKEVNTLRPYFKWDAQLVKNPNEASYGIKLVPVCMNNIKGWIDQVGRGTKRYTYSMVLPAWKLKLGFDRGARLVSRVETDVMNKIFVQFSPRTAWNTGDTNVFVWAEGTQSTVYEDVKACPTTDEATASTDATISLFDLYASFATH
jgi:hypothetical protein